MAAKNSSKEGKGPTDQVPLFHIAKPPDKPHKTFRIAVTGDVLVTRLEQKIIDSLEFQRLRLFKQLGMSYLVYPSAVHSRFEHSLGVLQMAETMMRFIQENQHSSEAERKISPEDQRLVRLTALLHDLGNIPFGHTLEDETRVIQSYQEDAERFEALLGKQTYLGKLIINEVGSEGHDLLGRVLSAKKDPKPGQEGTDKNGTFVRDLGERAYIYDIVKNTVCADLLDYLRRDCYFCNLQLGLPDRFLRFLYIESRPIEKHSGRRLAIRLWKDHDPRPRADIISELIQLLETRYFLAERVYFHHAKIIASAMISAAVWEAMHQEKDSLAYSRISMMGDDELIRQLRESKTMVARKLADRIYERKLYKRFYSLPREKLAAEKKQDLLERLKAAYHVSAENRAKVEKELCELCDLDPGDVVIYCPDPDMNLKLAEMFVTWKGDVKRFIEVDDKLVQTKIGSIIDSHKGLWELQVFVRPEAVEGKNKRDLLQDWCKAKFEDSELQRHATRATIEDVLRGAGREHTVTDVDSVLQDILHPTHKGELSRRSITHAIDQHFEKNKTE